MSKYFNDEAEAYTFTQPPNTVKGDIVTGNATKCVWCGKAMLQAEADEHGRCEFDSQFPFSSYGQSLSIKARGEIAIIMVKKGILP
jgi:hypothetical protein